MSKVLKINWNFFLAPLLFRKVEFYKPFFILKPLNYAHFVLNEMGIIFSFKSQTYEKKNLFVKHLDIWIDTPDYMQQNNFESQTIHYCTTSFLKNHFTSLFV